jgi:hypothetical protein
MAKAKKYTKTSFEALKKTVSKPEITEKPKVVEKPKPPPPPPKKEVISDDLFIVADEGYLGEDNTSYSGITRLRVKNAKGEFVTGVDRYMVYSGFGVDRKSAILDFIQRNDSRVIERVFNAST